METITLELNLPLSRKNAPIHGPDVYDATGRRLACFYNDKEAGAVVHAVNNYTALCARVIGLEAALRPFAEMDREDCDLAEVACMRGVASDMTIIISNDFRKARALLEQQTGLQGEENDR